MPNIIVIGDDSIRDLVYKCFIQPLSVTEGSKQNLITQSVISTIEIDHKSLKYNVENVSLSTSNSNFNIKGQFCTVIVCFNLDDVSDVSRFDLKLKEILQANDSELFNIIPVLVSTDKKIIDENKNFFTHMIKEYPKNCRLMLPIVRDKLEPMHTFDTRRSPIVKLALQVTLATPIYKEINKSIQLLDELDTKIIHLSKHNTSSQALPTSNFRQILMGGYKIGYNNGNRSVNIELLKYFNSNKNDLYSCLNILRGYLNQNGISHNDYATRILGNIVLSIGNFLSMLLIVGFPFACKNFSQNNRKHGNMFSFYATSYADELQASIIDAVDSIDDLDSYLITSAY